MEALPLFRSDARHPSHIAAQGEIVLIRPISFSFLVVAAAAIALLIVGFFIWGSYTKRSTLSGQLSPDLGVIKLYAPQFGTIMEKRVMEGGQVKQGDVLYVLTSERRSTALGNMQAMISEQVEARGTSLRSAIEQTKQLASSDQDSARKKLAGLQAERTKIDELIAGLKNRVALAEEAQARYDNLRKQGYLSQDDILARQTDLLDQRVRMQTLERDRITIQRQIDDQQAQIRQLPLRYQTQIAELDRAVASTEQELTQSEAVRKWVITAPQDGTASAVVGEVGQAVDSSRALLSIVPQGAKLQAQLYAPSRAVGFVKPGDKVYLRYQPYPYQKFGHYAGVVASVSRTSTATSELTGSNAAYSSTTANGGSEPVYRITVDLNSQSVLAYGKQQSLQAGMLVDADVLQETRHLYEWVLEPLITLTGKIH